MKVIGRMRYVVVIEEGPESFGAYVPDLPGCVAAGDSRQEVMDLIQEAIEFHLEGIREQPVGWGELANPNKPSPFCPHSFSEFIEVGIH